MIVTIVTRNGLLYHAEIFAGKLRRVVGKKVRSTQLEFDHQLVEIDGEYLYIDFSGSDAVILQEEEVQVC